MNFFTVFHRILFFIILTGFSQSAPVGMVHSTDLTEYIEKFKFEDYKIVLGDIMESISATASSLSFKNAIVDNQRLWNPKKPIPVAVQQSFPKEMKDEIETALNDIQNHTCLRFKNAEKDDNRTGVLVFTDGPGCSSFIGYKGGFQQIVMNSSACRCAGTAVHETMHALGFAHEQVRSDRDDYVEILTDNIIKEYIGNFEKLSPDQNRLLTAYDYDSIMHYPGDAFSKSPGLKTIQPKKKGVKLLNSCVKGKLSKLDIVKINKLYNCTSYLDGTKNPGKDVKPFVIRRM
ncbi:zinc metalloproteinase nas-4-like [Tetranychus urticae]|uniref:Metalloendopeptidase n=1 Tax=Tetranychus urticae TaxID=32264 RepID=T1K2V2_TETUR|nr:zinc metalloproteinase nas-4-like [Tetranychus urticae]